MNPKDAFTFLELPENATDTQIKKRLEEKLAHYEHLSQHSPSAFLRRLNNQHLSKALLIRKEIASILPKPLTIPVAAEEEIEVTAEPAIEENNSNTMPVIVSAALRTSAGKKGMNEPIAFLVRHTENKPVKPFPLYSGKNFIGRKVHSSLKPFIALEDDEFVSRLHAVIFVEEEEACYIDDSASSNEGKPSKNGTFINGDKQRVTERCRLNDNDAIQIGETKLIFRMNNTSIKKIVEEVQESDYMHTVIIRG